MRQEGFRTQEELGERIGVTGSTVSTWLRGTRKPDHPSINKLAEVLHVAPIRIYEMLGLARPVSESKHRDLLQLLEQATSEEYEEIMAHARIVIERRQRRERAPGGF
ncbi:MAG: helix-turn-helix domain-containing protein [Anaerolineae bacterium]